MIAKLKGKVDFLGNGFLILDVKDVGYKVYVSLREISNLKIGSETFLYIYTQVKEDILALYGFASHNDLAFFEQLLSVSGVGPKAGLNIISVASVEKIRESISRQDPALLYSVSGIGKKTAEKIVLELKNKVGILSDGNIFSNSSDTEELIGALEGLGYSRNEIQSALANISDGKVEDKIKQALKVLKR